MDFSFKIVGLKHQKFSPPPGAEVKPSGLKFKRDKRNKFDYYAVAVYLDSKQIGFVEREFSRSIACLLDARMAFDFQISEVDSYWIRIKCLLSGMNKVSFPETSSLPNTPGIYALRLRCLNGEIESYIGQSTNVRRRVGEHFSNLKKLTHHSYPLQSLWLSAHKTMEAVLLEEIIGQTKAETAELLLLFEDEYIQKTPNTLNIIEAELSDSEGGRALLQQEVAALRSDAGKIRKVLSGRKVEIGGLAIKMNLISTKYWHSERPLTASNVLTWLKKTKRSPLDWVPQVKTDHALYCPIRDSLQRLTNKIGRIGQDIKRAEELAAKLNRSEKGVGVEVLGEIRALRDSYEDMAQKAEIDGLVHLLVDRKILS